MTIAVTRATHADRYLTTPLFRSLRHRMRQNKPSSNASATFRPRGSRIFTDHVRHATYRHIKVEVPTSAGGFSMSGPVSSAFLWATATGATAIGLAWTSSAVTRVVSDFLLVVWLVLSNAR